jgi:hypothetical protein
MRIIVVFVFLTFQIISAAIAEELPNDLFHQCSGKSKYLVVGGVKGPDLSDEEFNITIHLKDGVLITIHLKDGVLNNVTDNVILGKGCVLAKGEIGCELKKIHYDAGTDSTETWDSIAFLVRETGEIRTFVDVLHFDGRKLVGSPKMRLQFERKGLCRKGSPIF